MRNIEPALEPFVWDEDKEVHEPDCEDWLVWLEMQYILD